MDNLKYLKIAKEMLDRAYAPFSKFTVGACLVGKSGKIYTGCNVENSSYGGTICAERTAFCKAVSEGEREFQKLILISGEGGVLPCGICRQFIKEFCEDDFEIITEDKEGGLKSYTLGQLLPEGFRLR